MFEKYAIISELTDKVLLLFLLFIAHTIIPPISFLLTKSIIPGIEGD